MQIIALFIALVVIVLLVQRKRPLYLVMAVGIAIVIISLDRTPSQLAELLLLSLVDRVTLQLVVATGMLSLLGRLLKDLGFLDNLADAMIGIFHNLKVIIMLIPALIGLFHVLGGAVLSAPVVENLGERLKLDPAVRSSVNLVFRHVVVYFSPFNPHLILLVAIFELEILQLLLLLIPVGLINGTAGYFAYLHRTEQIALPVPVEEEEQQPDENRIRNFRNLLYYGSPLIVSLGLFIILRVPLLPSIGAGLAAALLFGNRKGANWKEILIRGPNFPLMLGIAGIMVFRLIVRELDQLTLLMQEIAASGIPTFLLFIAVPMVIGLVSASYSITIGVTAPALLTLLGPGDPVIFYAVLLWVSGFTSYFVSPIHVCQVISNSYFCVNTFDAHRRQYLVLGLTCLAGLLVFALGVWFS